MKSIVKLKVLMSTLMLAACMQSTAVLSTGEAPQWVQNESEMYPNVKYLSATGSASQAEQAKARALSNLAKIFEVQIREVSTTTQDVQSTKISGVETVQINQRLATTVNLKTDKMVQGARIAEQWKSNVDRTYYALAVLDRSQAGNNIRSEMRQLDEETQFVLDQQQSRSDPLLKIADLHKANSYQQNRQALQKTLKIIDVKGRGVSTSWNLAELNEDLHRSLRALPIYTTVKVDNVGGFSAVLQGAVSDAGFNLGSSGYQLNGSLEALQTIKNDDWYWRRASVKIQLISQDGTNVIGYQSWPLKVSSGDESQLDARLLDAADKKLKQKLLSSVLEFAK